MDTDLSLRDHARGAVRDEVMKRAWMLFSEQGFEATTVDQIAAAAGMSRRTFFRYFTGGKDELVLTRLVESGDAVADALRARPADEAAWPALRAAFEVLLRPQEAHEEISRPLQLMLRDEPGARASVQEWHRRWLHLLTPLVRERLAPRRGGRTPDVRATAVTGSALSCLEAAQEAWAEHPGSRLGTLLDEAMTTVHPLG